MADKSPLEREIERRELARTPLWTSLLIVVLLACIGLLLYYVMTIKQELSGKEREIARISAENENLLFRLKNLERDLAEREVTVQPADGSDNREISAPSEEND